MDQVGFTGSSRVGARIGELTGRHLQSACLELGGTNPMVVTPSADIDLAVQAALFSGFGTAGQRRTSLGTVIVHGAVREEFTTSGAEAHLPVGGNGRPGNGSRQSGVWVLDQFTRWQSNWDYSGSLPKAQMDVAELIADASFRLAD